jgi:hypothetical protein
MVALETIKKDILEYKKIITVALEKSKPMPNDVKNIKPSIIRKNLDKVWSDITNKETEIVTTTEILNDCVKELEECKSIIGQINANLQKVKPVYNTATMGTLQGLTREILEKQNIKPYKNDIGANFVLGLEHDELAKIRSEKKRSRTKSRGGKKKTRRKRK